MVSFSCRSRSSSSAVRKPPRRVRTPYMYYVKQNYRRMFRKMLIRSPMPIIRALANEWRYLGEAQREEYIQKGRRDQKRYKDEMAEYARSFEGGKAPKRRRKKKDPKAPKRTRNAFIYYSQDMWPQVRMEFPTMSRKEMITEVARRWHECDDAGKEDYKEMVVADKRRYAMQLLEYKQKKLLEANLAALNRTEARRIAAQKRRAEAAAEQRRQLTEAQNAEQPPFQPAQPQEPPPPAQPGEYPW